MLLGPDSVRKRSREYAPKVRSGCGTCKARRVKCDETKPTCQRCAIRGRTCEYSTARISRPPCRKKITVYVPPPQNHPNSLVNSRELDFFNHSVATNLDRQSGSSDTFWSKLVLQLAHFELSVRHAVSALSITYQDVDSSLRHPAGYVKANVKAQQEWNKAIKSLSNRIQAHSDESLVPLVCCLLFTCIEFLRGNVEASMLHVQSGLNILASMHCSGHATLTPDSTPSSCNHGAIGTHIATIFSRLAVVCALAGRMTPPICGSPAREDSPHENLSDARQRLFEITDKCVRFIGKIQMKVADLPVDFEDVVEQVMLQTQLDTWRVQLDELVERTQTAGSQIKLSLFNLLVVHYKIINIWTRVCTTAGETATDAYLSDFEDLVDYAEQSVTLNTGSSTTPEPQLLSFDLGLLGPLYFTALKCRDPFIRRRALELLRFAPRREGLWNAHHAYMTAKRVIELEERRLNLPELIEKGYGWPHEADRVHGLPLPDDESRSYHLGMGDLKLDHSIVPSPSCPGVLEAVFMMKPWGLSAEWHMIREYIEL